jgi:hypothetical protein
LIKLQRIRLPKGASRASKRKVIEALSALLDLVNSSSEEQNILKFMRRLTIRKISRKPVGRK